MNDRLCFLDPPFDDGLETELRDSRASGTSVAVELFGGIGIRGVFDGTLDDLVEAIRLGGEPPRENRWMGARALTLQPAEIRGRGGSYDPAPALTFATGEVMRWFASAPAGTSRTDAEISS